MDSSSDVKLQNSLRRWASYLVWSVLVIAVIQLLGIFFKIDFLTIPVQHFHQMNEVTAVGMILSAVAFLLYTSKNSSRLRYISATILALVVLLSGILRFLSYVLQNYVDIKILFNRESLSSSTAFCGILAGVTLLLVNGKSFRKAALSHYPAAVIFLFAIFSVIVNSYNAQSFKGIFTVPMAFYSAVCFLLFSLAVFFANPDKGLMKELTTVYAGSIGARRLIPAALILPFLYGFVRLYGEWVGFYNREFATAVSVMAITITCVIFIIYNARMLNRRDMVNEAAKSELTEVNYFLHTVLENIPDMIFVKDAKELRFFRFNKAGEELLGYSKSDLIGKNDYDFFPKEQADFFTSKDRDVIKGNSVVDIAEEPIMTKNGERWLHTKKIPVYDENGLPLYVLGISEDITQRRKVDEQLRQLNADLERKVLERTEELAKSEVKFRKLLENNFEAISLSDDKFIPFYRSPAAERITGWSTDERIKADGSTDQIHPDDKERHKSFLQEVLRTSSKAIPFSFRAKHKEGHYIRLEGFMTNMLHDKNLNGIIANFRDVTEAKEAEERLTKILREFSDYRYALDESSIVAITDQKGIIKYANQNFCNVSKYTAEELIGEDHGIVNSGYHSKEFMRDLWITIANGEIWRGELKNKAKDGTIYWVDTTIVPFLNDDGKPYQYIAIRADITIKKKAEEEISKLTAELRELLEHVQMSREEERKYIAREIHDELGQRLTAMKIDVSMMRRKIPANGNQNYFADEVNSVISQIDQSIESVKRIATDLRPEILDHHGVIAAVKWQTEQFENVTGLKCKLSYMPDNIDLEPELSTAVYRTVQEALTNISRHAQATAVSILIELDAEKLLIEIKDNGKGINEEQIKSMTSLGLIGIRERIHLLKGSLSISGKPGKGTTVSATIPL